MSENPDAKNCSSHLLVPRKVGSLFGMTKGRMEAFTDGVIAILITIMVLDLKLPSAVDCKTFAPCYRFSPAIR